MTMFIFLALFGKILFADNGKYSSRDLMQLN